MNQIIQFAGFGVVTASVLALAAVGLTLQFGVTNFINFAYGEFLTLGAYFTWVLNVAVGWNIWLALLVSALGVGIVAVLLNRLVFQHFVLRKVSILTLLIVTLGMSLILQNVMLGVWGPNFKRFAVHGTRILHLGPMIFTVTQLVVIGIAVAAMIAIYALLTFTKAGKAMRAMSDSSDLARVCGIDTIRVTDLTWLVSGVLAGIAGVTLTLSISSFEPATGSGFLFVIFAAVILGGIGRPYGAMAGALVIGLVTEISAAYLNSAYKNSIAFAILILVLLVRPQGIFTTRGKA